MSLLDDPNKIIFKADLACKLEACKEWINNHLPNSIKNDPSICLTGVEYESINKYPEFYEHLDSSRKMGNIFFAYPYDDKTNDGKYIYKYMGMIFNKMYLYIEDNEIKLDITNNGLLVLENAEDIPDFIMELILPLMVQDAYIAADLEQEIIKSRWTYRKGRVIFNYINPELMSPHRTIYIKNEI